MLIEYTKSKRKHTAAETENKLLARELNDSHSVCYATDGINKYGVWISFSVFTVFMTLTNCLFYWSIGGSV